MVAHLLKSFKGKLLNHIKPSDIESYKTNRKSDGISGSTINRELAALKRIFNNSALS
ncbi:MAG: site-specific integrase [Promethearchaeota archaeon]